jgi:hypothetical protein
MHTLEPNNITCNLPLFILLSMIHVLSHIRQGVFEVRLDEMNMLQNNCVKVECCSMFVNSSYSNLNQVYEKMEILSLTFQN